VKLPFDSPNEARRRLERCGAVLVRERSFEDNVLFDRRYEPLKPEDKALRLRRVGRTGLLTFKAPVPGRHRHKVRVEEETVVADPQAMRRILDGLGFSVAYRYQKYRSEYRIRGIHACLDETPLGCFVELEGAPDAIDAVAAELGFSPSSFVCQSYRELHEIAARARGEEPGDLLMAEKEGTPL